PRTTREPMKRQLGFAPAQVPKRRVDGGKSNRGEGAHSRRVNVKEEVAPNAFDLISLAPEQAGNEVIVEQLDHRRSAGADGIAVACSGHTVSIRDAYHRRLL